MAMDDSDVSDDKRLYWGDTNGTGTPSPGNGCDCMSGSTGANLEPRAHVFLRSAGGRYRA